MDRETITIETPVSKQEVVIYSYLTGREIEYVRVPLLQSMPMRSGGVDGLQMGDLDVNKVQESTHRLIEKQVVSIAGSTENILDTVLDMRQTDYEFIVSSLNDQAKKN